jgi:hypothetical protein
MDWKEALSQLKELHIEKTSDSVVVKFKLHPRIQGRNKLKIKSAQIYGYLIAKGLKIEKGSDDVFRNNDGVPEEHCLRFLKAAKSATGQKKPVARKKTVPKVSPKEG